jgi:hypothetical protein
VIYVAFGVWIVVRAKVEDLDLGTLLYALVWPVLVGAVALLVLMFKARTRLRRRKQ